MRSVYSFLLASRAAGEAQTPIREPYIFVPLQVNKDTQIRSYSPHIPNMHSFVEVVHKAWRSLNHDNLRLVVKEHPAETLLHFGLLRFFFEQ